MYQINGGKNKGGWLDGLDGCSIGGSAGGIVALHLRNEFDYCSDYFCVELFSLCLGLILPWSKVWCLDVSVNIPCDGPESFASAVDFL